MALAKDFEYIEAEIVEAIFSDDNRQELQWLKGVFLSGIKVLSNGRKLNPEGYLRRVNDKLGNDG